MIGVLPTVKMLAPQLPFRADDDVRLGIWRKTLEHHVSQLHHLLAC